MVKAVIFDFFNVILVDGRIDTAVLELAGELRKRHKTALLTNVSHLERYIDRPVLDNTFDMVAASDEIGVAKPDPRAFRYVLDALSIEPSEAILVDDIASYVSAAETIGMKGIVYRNVKQLRQELARLLKA
jgi:HAD superfamily hydrolase (TIGR01509 family)